MWLRILVGVILFAIIAPLFLIILMSFTSASHFSFPPPSYSLKWYAEFFGNQEWMESILLSLKVAFFTTILATIIGTIAANAVVRLNFRGKKLFMSLMIAPMIIPIVIVGIALFRSFSTLHLNGTTFGLVLGHSMVAIPIVFVTVMTSLKAVDQNLEKAAMGLGSTPLSAFFKVTVPLIRPGIFSGAVFAFIASFDETVITIFISGSSTNTLPVKMWENLRTSIEPTIAAISAFLIVTLTVIYLIQQWIELKQQAKS